MARRPLAQRAFRAVLSKNGSRGATSKQRSIPPITRLVLCSDHQTRGPYLGLSADTQRRGPGGYCSSSAHNAPMKQLSDKSNITLINVFTVHPSNQQRLVDLLTRAADNGVSRAPGFLSATLHRSIDGTKVTMYAQWRSAEDYHAMRQDPAPLPFLEEALSIAKFEPGIYEVVRTFSPSP